MVVALGTEVVICTDPEAVATPEVVAASPAALQPRSYQLELFEYACKQNVRVLPSPLCRLIPTSSLPPAFQLMKEPLTRLYRVP